MELFQASSGLVPQAPNGEGASVHPIEIGMLAGGMRVVRLLAWSARLDPGALPLDPAALRAVLASLGFHDTLALGLHHLGARTAYCG
jgi:hypothetical protein